MESPSSVMPSDGAPIAESASLRYSALVALAWVAGVRLFLTLYLGAASLLFPQPDLQQQYAGTGVHLYDSGWQGAVLGVWQREDALWYEKIASVGYSTGDMTQEFFPLFPMLMRALALETGMPAVAAGILISEISLVGTLFLLHRMVYHQFGSRTANLTISYLALFPTAFFLHAPFSESLFLLLAVAGFFLIERNRWAEAAGVGFLAGLARPQGMLLGIPLALQFLSEGRALGQWRSISWDRRKAARAVALVVAPLLGLTSVLIAVDSAWRRPGVPSGIGPGHGIPALPGAALVFAVQNFMGGVVYPIEAFNFIVALGFIFLVVAALPRLGIGYACYALIFFLVPLSRYMPGFALMSFSRYVLVLFPCFLMLALWAPTPQAGAPHRYLPLPMVVARVGRRVLHRLLRGMKGWIGGGQGASGAKRRA